MITIKDIAKVAHEANRAYCESIGDYSQPPWHQAPDWQRESAENGVEYVLANPESTPEQSHENWAKQKIEDGWVYGEEKDPEAKTHHCLVDSYDQLPEEQRVKDYIFRGVVLSFKDFI